MKTEISKISAIMNLRGRMIYVVFILVCIILTSDVFLIKFYSLGINLYVFTANQKIVIFLLLAFGGVATLFIISHQIENKIRESKTALVKYLAKLHTMFRAFHYSLATLLVLVSLQMIYANEYYTISLIIVVSFSYALMVFLLGFLSLRFISWLKFNKSAVGISYSIAMMSLVIYAIFTVVQVDFLLWSKPATTGPYGGGSMYISTIGDWFDNADMAITIASFILTWIATAFLLYHYSYKFGKLKYWTLVCAPLIYFLSQFFILLPNQLDQLIVQDPVFYSAILTVIFTASKIVGGVFFGIAFWLISKSLPSGNIIKGYLAICSFGFIMFFISAQSVSLVIAPYPPFGMVSTAFIGLSSYMILVGIYSSALSASHDTKLRQSIRNLAKTESKLLGSIGRAQADIELQNKVTKLTRQYKDYTLNETGIPFTITEEDAKKYLIEVLDELKTHKAHKPNR